MRRAGYACAGWLALLCVPCARPQQASQQRSAGTPAYQLRAQRFLAGRTEAGGASGAAALNGARAQHLEMVWEQGRASARIAGAHPHATGLGAAWTAVGPVQVASQSFGNVTGRVTSIAIDPADATGNTVYLGTTGGGVWKATNAAGPAANVTFTPLTDTLPVFSPNSGAAAVPSLSIGAVSVAQYAGADIVLAGTGDANDATDSYYGEGILRSVDGGATWTLAQESNDGAAGNHSFLGLGVAGFAWSTAAPGLVVLAVSQAAEGTIVNAPDGTYSVMGLYYSTDAGATWKMATIKDGTQTVEGPNPGGAPGNAATAVVWNPVRQRFYAAVRFHGYYESADGVAWTRLPNQPGTGLTGSACPPNFGSTGSVNCPIFRGALAVNASTGDTFALTADANNLDQGLWQDVCGLSGGSCAVNEIAFATRLNSSPLDVGSGSTEILQADYDLTLNAVASGGDTLLFAGTVDLNRCSIAAGCVLRNTTNAENGCAAPAMVAPAQHAIAALAGAGASGLPLVYLGNDGGLWRSVDGVDQQQTPCSPDDKTHFNNLNGGLGSLAEVTYFAQDPSDPGTLIAGLGANGTAATTAAAGGGSGFGPWPQIAAGEGGAVAIDPANPQNWYVSIAAGVNLRYCSKGGACTASDFAGAPTIGSAQVANDEALIDAPVLLDPQLPTGVLIGTCRVWRGPADSAATWPGTNEVSTEMGAGTSGVCGASNAYVRSLAAGGPASGASAVQDAGSTVLYAGMAGSLDGGSGYGGHLFVDRAAGMAGAGTLWSDAAQSTVANDPKDSGVFNPAGFDISSIAADRHDATGMTVYATVMGFTLGENNIPHVYRSTDGGASWTNISANLPTVPANAVLIDPNDANTVYVAMDTGVYATSAVTTCATANCWGVMGVSLPNAPVVGLQASAAMATGDGRFGELRAATYGRGIWQIPLLTAHGPAAPAMTLNPTSLTFGTQQVGTASAVQTISVTNSGNAALTVTQITASGDFSETDNCVGASGGIAPNVSCTVSVTFLPQCDGDTDGSAHGLWQCCGWASGRAAERNGCAAGVSRIESCFGYISGDQCGSGERAGQHYDIEHGWGNGDAADACCHRRLHDRCQHLRRNAGGEHRLHGERGVCADGLGHAGGQLQHYGQRGNADGGAERGRTAAGDGHARAPEPELRCAAVEYRERGADGDADQLGRCGADTDRGADNGRFQRGERMRGIAERPFKLRVAGDVCADRAGHAHRHADGKRPAAQPDGGAQRERDRAAGRVAGAGLAGELRGGSCRPDDGGADGDADEQRWHGAGDRERRRDRRLCGLQRTRAGRRSGSRRGLHHAGGLCADGRRRARGHAGGCG